MIFSVVDSGVCEGGVGVGISACATVFGAVRADPTQFIEDTTGAQVDSGATSL